MKGYKMKYRITDWKGNKLFKGKEFNSIKEGWDYVDIINYPEELCVVKSDEAVKEEEQSTNTE
jgi:hypothetical protein|tara:strand:+ start:299 stop:487 length:189 start_codon:yes stop_codon:yes gene_type:complete